MRTLLMLRGAEEEQFERVPEVWIFASWNPWIVGPRRSYFVSCVYPGDLSLRKPPASPESWARRCEADACSFDPLIAQRLNPSGFSRRARQFAYERAATQCRLRLWPH